ncbi:MAG: TolC family protein [Verrucomicrobiota bacterium]
MNFSTPVRYINQLYLVTIVLLQVYAFQKMHSEPLNIAVIETAGQENKQASIFKNEIVLLFEGDRDVNFISYPIRPDEDGDRIDSLFELASQDATAELILVLDIAGNQSLGTRSTFTKPTFLPFVINARLRGLPLSGESSGKENLNYLTVNFDFADEIKTFGAVAQFKNAVLISDPRVEKTFASGIIEEVKAQAQRAGVNLSVETYSGDISALTLPADTDAVFYGFLPSSTEGEIKALIDHINERGIASFSLIGEEYVNLGALATNNPTTDWEKLARRTALHMEEVLLGTPASELPVFFESSNSLIINMETSRQIRIAPSFDVLSEATLINELPETADQNYTLTDVAKIAVEENLSILAQRFQSERAKESVKDVRGNLLPQIGASVSYIDRKDDTALVRTGFEAENQTDGSITLTQSLFSEELWAAFAIEKFSALSERELEKEIELDIIQTAVNAYLNVLREKTSLEQERYNLDITRENYRLAENRVSVGEETAADLFRWESELANAKQGVLAARSSFVQQKQILNQILNRPISEEFTTSVETLENPALLISDPRISTLIKNVYDLETLTNYFVAVGLEQSPELKQIEANIEASKRQLKSDTRSFWLPDVSLIGEYSSNFDEERAAGGTPAEDEDWSVGVEFSIPIFEGGSRFARTRQSRLTVRQLETNLRDTSNLIEQDVRNNLERAHASYNSIPLAKQAEIAAQKNYELIQSSYEQGARSITDVLDAQETLIDAREASLNAVYTFLINLMDVQRAIGAFDFFLTDTQRMDLSDELIMRVSEQN